MKEKRLQAAQTSEKTLELLEILAGGNRDLNILDLSHQLQISRNDVLLMLTIMESRGVVRWDEATKVYRPGGTSLTLAKKFLKNSGAKSQARMAC